MFAITEINELIQIANLKIQITCNKIRVVNYSFSHIYQSLEHFLEEIKRIEENKINSFKIKELKELISEIINH